MRVDKEHGFTYIELLVASALIGLMAMMALPLLSIQARREREFELSQNLRDIRSAIDRYKQATDSGKIEKSADSSGYPPSLQVLADGVPDRSDASGRGKIYFLRRIPRDPVCDCPEREDADTWLRRSYASPPDDPQAGDDVFDVYSRSQQKGSNEVPYKEW